MAKFEFKLPDIGEGVTEGEIVGWLVKVGDQLAENQDMVEVMTDKATVTIGAPKAGRVAELRGAVGDTVPVGTVIVVLDVNGAAGTEQPKEIAPAAPAKAEAAPQPAAVPPSKPQAAAPDEQGPVASAVGDLRESLPGMGQSRAASGARQESGYFAEQPLAAPATRKLARELGVDLRRIEPTGKGGRVTREDVETASTQASGEPRESTSPQSASAQPLKPIESTPAPVSRQATDNRVPIRGLRKRIYENMTRAKRMAAHFTYVDDCDASALIALRGRLAPRAEQLGVKLNYLPFIVKAVVCALKAHPMLNALVDDAAQEIVLRSGCDIGIGTATDAGLIVPVL